MNRKNYFDYIDEKLNVLSARIIRRGKINLLDLNIHSENFFADMLNLIFAYELINMNAIHQNMEGIDLIDSNNKIVAQVSSTCTKAKIEKSLGKEIFKEYKGYRFIFISIGKDAAKLRKVQFKNPYEIQFNPETDIYDVTSMLRQILNMRISEQQKLYQFIRDELGDGVDMARMDSNMTAIINILSKENLGNVNKPPEINSFEIQRKIEFNKLVSAQKTIDEHTVFYSKLDEKYTEFDRQGKNRSLSVFSCLSSEYAKLKKDNMEAADMFFTIINNVVEIVRNSRNYIDMPYEELEMCVSIIVVDAFVRCKIYENPEGYNHVIAR